MRKPEELFAPEERLSLLEYQMQLMLSDDPLNRLWIAYLVTEDQTKRIIDFLISLRDKIEAGEKPHHYDFESAVYGIIPARDGDFQFCQTIARTLYREDHWKETVKALYGEMPAFKEFFRQEDQE